MPRARRKQFNSINAASLARWLVLTAFLSVLGLIYVYWSLQVNDLAKQRTRLEEQLTSMRKQTKIESDLAEGLKSRDALKKRLAQGYLRMIPIAEQNIVRLSPSPGAEVADALADR